LAKATINNAARSFSLYHLSESETSKIPDIQCIYISNVHKLSADPCS